VENGGNARPADVLHTPPLPRLFVNRLVPGKSNPDLSGVRLKLDRAEAHIETVGEQIGAFRERDPAPFGFRSDPEPRANQPGEYVLYAVIREPPPRELALPIGDALQNMRAALDHFAYELSSPSAQKSGKTAFPIYTDECRFKANGVPRIKTITGHGRAFIERMQPYSATKIPTDDPLEILRTLSNLDKHRLLVPVIAALSDRDSWVAATNAEIRFRYLHRGPAEHDAKIVAFTATPKDPSVDMEVQPSSGLQMQLDKTGIVGFEIEALELLKMILHHIRWSMEWLFERGVLPPTWREVEARQS
jgi:hypothetical protein